jgi:hypothetical protein
VTQFWPPGLDLTDTASPLDILEEAQREWAEQSQGLLALVIQEAESTDGDRMLIVHAKHVPSNRTATLFSVVHRSDAPYPAKIQPRENELPDFLKKSYYRPGIGDLSAGMGLATGRQVTNKWVCDTPSEFRSELRNVLNLGIVKSEVLSIVSGHKSPMHNDEEAEEKEPV